MAAAAASSQSTDPILVFGATGTVGSQVVTALLESKTSAKIYAFVRDEGKGATKFGDKVHFIKGDTSKADDIKKAFKTVGAGARVFLLTYPLPPHGVTVEATIAQQAVEHKAHQVVKLSAYSVALTDTYDSLTRHQAEAEAAVIGKVEGSSTAVSILRPNYFFQNFISNDAAGIKGQKALYRVSGDYKISAVDVRDIALAATTLLTAADPKKYHLKTFDLTGPDSLTTTDFAAILSEVLETKINPVFIDDAALYHTLLSYHLPDQLATALVKLYQGYRFGRVAPVQGDFKILTGKEPRSFKQFVQDHKAAFTA